MSLWSFNIFVCLSLSLFSISLCVPPSLYFQSLCVSLSLSIFNLFLCLSFSSIPLYVSPYLSLPSLVWLPFSSCLFYLYIFISSYPYVLCLSHPTWLVYVCMCFISLNLFFTISVNLCLVIPMYLCLRSLLQVLPRYLFSRCIRVCISLFVIFIIVYLSSCLSISYAPFVVLPEFQTTQRSSLFHTKLKPTKHRKHERVWKLVFYFRILIILRFVTFQFFPQKNVSLQ